MVSDQQEATGESATEMALAPTELPAVPVDVASSGSSSTMPPMTQIEMSLFITLTELAVRSEVNHCLSDMLMDVETTYYLRHEFERESAKYAMVQTNKHHQATILEANSERHAREQTHLELADQMVQEVMSFSKEMEDLLKWKRDHAHKVEEYDLLVQKLARTEQDLEVVKERVKNMKEGAPILAVNDTLYDTIKEKPLEEDNDKAPEELTETERKPAATIDPITPVASVDDNDEKLPDTDTNNEEDLLISGSSEEAIAQEEVKPASVQPASPAPAGAAVVLDEEEEDEKATSLVDLDVEILMTIFGFIDAMDILNMAQINLAMYNKIDNIFGISEDGQSPPQPTAAPTPAPVQPSPVVQQPLTAAQTTPTIATLPSHTSGPRPAPQHPPTLATLPSSASAQSSATGAAPPGPIGNRLFSILQPAKAAPGAKKGAPSLTPSAVQSMAAKLNDSEVAAILSMTDKLHRMDKEVQVLRQEKEELAAKLNGTEHLNQFLTGKVLDVENKLARSRDDEVKVVQQIASDQEVIAFLDSRVQELERQTKTLTKEKSECETELSTTKVQTSKKITMLSDMLKYEREKLKDEEGEWKATKKVLVKEVKSCRAQILALQAERDGLREQNEMLKRAIVTTGKSPSNRPRGESAASSGTK